MREPDSQGGFVLIAIVMALAIVGAVAFLLNRQGAMGVKLAGSSFEATQARYVAEAGFEHERWRLNQRNCVAYTDLPTSAFGSHTYSATVASTSGSPVTITGTGTLATGASHQLRRSNVPIFGDLRVDSIRPSSGGIRDTYLADGALSNTAFGASPDLLVSDATSVDRALIGFDLSNLPSTTRVTSAVLELDLEDVAFGGAGSTEVHRVTRRWTESEVTWNERRSGATWTTPGGDYDPQVVASTGIDVAQLGSTQWDVTPLVASWVSGRDPNHGMLLTASNGIDGARFSSGDRVCGQYPRLTVTYTCECGQPCQLVGALGQTCSWDSLPNAKVGEFSTTGGGDIWDFTFLPECVTFNGVAAPADGAWLGVDYSSSTAYMVDTAGNPLTSLVVVPQNVLGIELIRSGAWIDHLALADEADQEVYYLDLSGNVQGSFSTAGFTQHPVGVAFIHSSATGTYDGYLAISSDKDGLGGSVSAIYIVDQAGSLKMTIDVSALTPEPWGVTHLPGTDRLLVAAKVGPVYVIDLAGALIAQYDAAAFGATQVQGLAINPLTGDHVVNDHDTATVKYLNSFASGYRDEFNSQSFAGSNGALLWSNAWQELGESNGANQGRVRVSAGVRCASTRCLRIGANGGSIIGRGVSRAADLTGFSRATLSFSYRRWKINDGAGSVTLAVSSDGGTSWTDLATYDVNAGSDASQVPEAFDLTPHMGPNTQIRFLGLGNDVKGYIHFDNIDIASAGCSGL